MPATRLAPSEVRPRLLEEKRGFATSEQLARWLRCRPEQVATRLRRQRDAGELVSVTKGGWTVGFDGYADPDDYLEPMMRHLGCDYYLSGHAAADRLGLHTHRIQLLTVVTNRRLRNRRIGGSHFQFLHRPDLYRYPTHIVRSLTYCGIMQPMRMGTPPIILLDIVQQGVFYMTANVAGRMLDWGILPEYGTEPPLEPHALAASARLYPVAVRQRAGYVLQEMSSWAVAEWEEATEFDLEPLRATIPAGCAPVALSVPDVGGSVLTHDLRWNVNVNLNLEHDL